MTTVKSSIQKINSSFTDSREPQCFFDGEKDAYILNEAAYNQIQRVADMLAAIATFADGKDKRTEQLFNTISFASDLLEQSTSWNLL